MKQKDQSYTRLGTSNQYEAKILHSYTRLVVSNHYEAIRLHSYTRLAASNHYEAKRLQWCLAGVGSYTRLAASNQYEAKDCCVVYRKSAIGCFLSLTACPQEQLLSLQRDCRSGPDIRRKRQLWHRLDCLLMSPIKPDPHRVDLYITLLSIH